MAAQRKRLVVCFDGTWNSADSAKAETNVAIIARAVKPQGEDGIPQLTVYLRGVGTSGDLLERVLAGATGDGVDENIRSGYMFLAQNYVPGDSIYIFGFSRGAFSARSLVGFIGSCGLLEREFLGRVSEAWSYYRTPDPRTPAQFCERYSVRSEQGAMIDFLGVWDTVGALGIPGGLMTALEAAKYEFHNTLPSKIVKVGRHALSIDEHRGAFAPTLWTGDEPSGSDIKQVWFAGVHSDVGGGYQKRLLAEIPLRWIATEAVAAGLKLDLALLTSVGDLDPLAAQHESREGWSEFDKVRPTVRQIAGAAPDVGLLAHVYVSKDNAGNVVPTINEGIHERARLRVGHEVIVLDGGANEVGKPQVYKPENLTAAMAKLGLPIQPRIADGAQ